MPAINTNNETFAIQPEIMGINEDGLVLQCALEMIKNIDVQIQESRNLMELSHLKMHREVVNSMIEKFTSSHLKVS